MAQETQLNQLQQNMNSINLNVIVLDQGQIRRTQTGTILTMKVADQTGCINATVMNPEFGETWQRGDILKIRGAYTSVYQGGLTLSIGRNGECKKMGEFIMQFSDNPDISSMPLPAVQSRGNDTQGGQGNPNRVAQGVPGGRTRNAY